MQTHHPTPLLRLRERHRLVLLALLFVADHKARRSVRRSNDLDLPLGPLDEAGLTDVGEGGGEDGLDVGDAWEGEDRGGVEIDGGFGVERDLGGDLGEGDRGWVGEDAVRRENGREREVSGRREGRPRFEEGREDGRKLGRTGGDTS